MTTARKQPDLHAFVSRGANAGTTILYPHRHGDDTYVVSMTRFERDYIRVVDPGELLGWLERGYRLRMSHPGAGIPAPSLIHPRSIYRRVIL